jgi:hypothetical protein
MTENFLIYFSPDPRYGFLRLVILLARGTKNPHSHRVLNLGQIVIYVKNQ